MADKAQLLRDMQKLFGMFPSFMTVADDLAKIGSLEQAEAEAKMRLSAAQDAIAKAQASLEDIQAQVAEKRQLEFERASQRIADAEAKAEKIVDEATQKAVAIIAEATRIEDDHKKRGERALNDISIATRKLDEIDEAIKHKQNRLTEVSQQVSLEKMRLHEAKAQHQDFLKKIGAVA